MTEGIFLAKAAAYIGAGFAVAIGSIGPALGQGMVGKQACEAIGKNPEGTGKIRLTMILAMSFIESAAIYALVIALLLIFYS
ncbi:ATP synthase F0 subunit C [candidate division TM6 bacterium RIFCSPHIGHO2_12_FULL_36_22]|nr:MAG: ATP synthase F0 subunit C [candidate division TM6 bacterium RIFCSPHIGHO2_12_FULL_36_22]